MNSLPAEILLEIGKIDKVTYRGMLAIPGFTRTVTIGYRLDIMISCKYDHIKLLPNIKTCSHHSFTIRSAGSQLVKWGTWSYKPSIYADIRFEDHTAAIGYVSSLSGTSYKHRTYYGNDGSRYNYVKMQFIQPDGSCEGL